MLDRLAAAALMVQDEGQQPMGFGLLGVDSEQ